MLSEQQLKAALRIPDNVWLGNVDIDFSVPEVGRGADGTVHKAVYGGRPVAVKVLHAELITNTSPAAVTAFLQRFGRECTRLLQLRHPRVVEFVGVGRSPNGSPCLVTELMESPLARCATHRGEPSDFVLVQLVQYACDIAEGLRFLHGRGMIHRDLKPENVLVVAGRAKLADVGIARSMHGDGSAASNSLGR